MEAPDAGGGGGDNEATANPRTSVAMANPEQLRLLTRLHEWLKTNGVLFWGCEIRHSSDGAGLGVFASEDKAEGAVMVTPLRLAITPTSVLQDPDVGVHFMLLMRDGGIDDRLLIILFLVIQRARGHFSFWAPWLDVLPTKFGTTTSFSEDELLELKGTHLSRATKMRIKALQSSFEGRAKPIADLILSGVESERKEVEFQDFLWANSIFWTRAKSFPCPRSVVFPDQRVVRPPPSPRGLQQDEALSEATDVQMTTDDMNISESEAGPSPSAADEGEAGPSPSAADEGEAGPSPSAADEGDMPSNVDEIDMPSNPNEVDMPSNEAWCGVSNEAGAEDVRNSSINVEGLVPGIDFCNHDRTALALWEIDGPEAYATGVPNSMYLNIPKPVPLGEEIFISYGPKGNEELLFLYGFVLEDNPDDYLMIYFPEEALEKSVCSGTKQQLIERLNLPLRWIILGLALKRGFYEEFNIDSLPSIPVEKSVTGHSWSGNRKASPLAKKVVFPEDLLTALRILAMDENQVNHVVSMLEDVSDPEAGRIPSNADIMAALWEACGNAGAFQLLVDLLTFNLMELEDGTGTEAMDAELMAKHNMVKEQSYLDRGDERLLSDKKRASVIYRMGQKRLVRAFLKEAEMALEVCLDYVSSP